MKLSTHVDPVAECSILIRFESPPSDKLSWVIGEISHYLSNQLGAWIMNVTPSFDSILIDYLPHRISVFEFVPYLEKLVLQAIENMPDSFEADQIELPVFYDISVGPDLQHYLDTGLSIDSVIEAHTAQDYSVGAIGFSAGFAFLTGVTDSLQRPRKSEPRVSVPKGSVGIANNQTAVYPSSSPGGWNIIGNCPIDLFRPNQANIIPFQIGHKVKFRSICREEFISLGGVFDEGWQ
jgi:KipI family sensor histidine kinase inhibitor